jgi:hypothetical protein
MLQVPPARRRTTVSTARSNRVPTAPPRRSGPIVTTVLAVMTGIGTVVLHAVGSITHISYLRAWGVEPDLFSKPVDWIMLNGYYSLADRAIAAMAVIGEQLLVFSGCALVGGLYVAFVLEPFGIQARMPQWLRNWPARWRRFVQRTVLVFSICLALPFVLLMLTTLWSIPAVLGVTAGQSIFQQHRSEVGKGCELSRYHCIELRRDGNPFMTGFLIDSSSTHIAVFDMATGRAHAIERAGIEVVGAVPSK